MRAIVMHQRGGPEVLTFEPAFPDPTVGPDDVLMRRCWPSCPWWWTERSTRSSTVHFRWSRRPTRTAIWTNGSSSASWC